MKIVRLISALAFLAHSAYGHYIFTTLIAGSTTSTAAVRQPFNNSPVSSVTSATIKCNANTKAANVTVSVAAGATIGFKCDNTIYHPGPAAIYLGSADGSSWFKIAEWGAKFTPSFQFTDQNLSQLTTTIPAATPSGEYLIRVEQIGLHVVGKPQFYISCAQIKITGGGSGTPPTVAIPGYISATDHSITMDIFSPVPTSYKVPGPAVWRG